ncbi:MAG TPA: ATP-binding protein [Oligoflexia bacterium]|nr:ATP-binding protein [Oligoflexia bacterium]HMP47274.1 ATP-binding protein [Oligoflexia bacterium]
MPKSKSGNKNNKSLVSGDVLPESVSAEPFTARGGPDRDAFRLVANLTHELKTPLHSILSVAGLLAAEVDGPISSEQKKQVEIIQRNGTHLLELINSLLNYSSGSAESRAPDLERVCPSHILKSIIDELSPLALNQGISLSLNSQRVPEYIYTDLSLFRRIIVNLLGNALKFTRTGGEVIVNLEGQTIGGGLFIEVIDTGIGMSSSTKESLFRAFYQEDGSNTREFGGVGLGLSLVKSAVEKLSGEISVESELGQGSIFRVRLPDQSAFVKIPEIHVVDEDSIARAGVTMLLREEGYNVWSGNFDQLSERLLSGVPDLLIIDVGPPSFHGLLVLKNIITLLPDAKIPVIGMSASVDPKSRLKAFDEGVSDLIAKPFESKELIVRVKTQLERRRKSE